jgi:hypothetical protein
VKEEESVDTRRFGKTDMDVSVLGFGGAEIGFEGAGQWEVDRLLGEALDAGLNVIDTAPCYATSEALIGEAIGARRDSYYLFTKCGHVGTMAKEDWSRGWILESIQNSLTRLKTDHLDVVLLHSCTEGVLRKGEAIEALQEAKKKGYTRYIGYSGDHLAAKYAIECGAFDVLETSVNIADQESLDLTLPLARERDMAVIAKRPIANAAWKAIHKPTNPYHQEYWERLKVLDFDFLSYDLQEAVAIALRFTLAAPGVHTLIVGTKKPGRWQENASLVSDGPLSVAEVEAIRERWRVVADASWVGQV